MPAQKKTSAPKATPPAPTLPDDYAVIETRHDGVRWFYPVYLARNPATGYLAPAYFPAKRPQQTHSLLTRYGHHYQAVAFLRKMLARPATWVIAQAVAS